MLLWCLYGACTVLLWCLPGFVWIRQLAGLLIDVRILVFREVRDLDAAHAAGLVTLDESAFRKVVQRPININAVRREDGHLDALRPVLEAAGAVCERPEADEEQPRFERKFDEILVGEEGRLNVAGSSHQIALSIRCPIQRTHGTAQELPRAL